jgi:glutaminyl-peptide cyclotransferase
MAAAACAAPQPPTPFAPPETLTVEVVGERPHDPTAYTEGLVASEGLLYESTGLYEQSTLREVDAISGSIRRSLALDDRYFGEGIAVVDDTIIQLTWREHTALVYQLSDFAPIGTYSYETEGWGLCDDGERIAMSDGTSKLYFRNRSTFALLSSVTVASDRAAVDGLNELECVGGDVYANVYQTDTIVRIDPSSGRVTATIDGSSIHPTGHDVGVMNGIAYDKSAGTFLLTGKNWPTMFEVRLVPDE